MLLGLAWHRPEPLLVHLLWLWCARQPQLGCKVLSWKPGSSIEAADLIGKNTNARRRRERDSKQSRPGVDCALCNRSGEFTLKSHYTCFNVRIAFSRSWWLKTPRMPTRRTSSPTAKAPLKLDEKSTETRSSLKSWNTSYRKFWSETPTGRLCLQIRKTCYESLNWNSEVLFQSAMYLRSCQ